MSPSEKDHSCSIIFSLSDSSESFVSKELDMNSIFEFSGENWFQELAEGEENSLC